MKRLPWLTVLLLLVGCAAAKTTYLQLSPVPADHHLTVHGAALAVDRVQIPPTIDRIHLTTATGAETLNVAGHVRWAAPLQGMTTHVLATDLAERIQGVHVLMPGDPTPPEGVRRVRVNITKFLPIAGGREAGHVVLDADWRLIERNGHVMYSQRSHMRLKATRKPASQAAAMSQALGHLSDLIAGALASH